MGNIIDQVEGKAGIAVAVRCPFCSQENRPGHHCRHVRWTFDQGGPLDFARFCLVHSPYVYGRGHKPTEVPASWWTAHGDWLVEEITLRFHAGEGYVFGDLATIDVLARDIWKRFCPDDEGPQPRSA